MPSDRGLCIECGVNPQKKRSRDKGYALLCSPCDKRRYSQTAHRRHVSKYVRRRRQPYRQYVGTECVKCGFIPEHSCQLDVDHIDGNHDNNDPTNLQTLCANCHRLKTYRQLWNPLEA